MFPKNKTGRVVALAVVALAFLAVGLIFVFGINRPKAAATFTAAAQLPQPVSPAATAAPAVVTEDKNFTPGEEDTGQYLALPAGNLRRLTELTAELEETKLEAAIGEQRARLNKLDETASLPQTVLAGPAAGSSLAILPSSAPRVVSVQGIDGRITASVETASGLKTLSVGDSFGAGRVERINAAGVHTKGDQGTHLFNVEE